MNETSQMKNKYVDFVTDEYLTACISSLYDSYTKAKADISKKKFFKNKIDTFKSLLGNFAN